MWIVTKITKTQIDVDEMNFLWVSGLSFRDKVKISNIQGCHGVKPLLLMSVKVVQVGLSDYDFFWRLPLNFFRRTSPGEDSELSGECQWGVGCLGFPSGPIVSCWRKIFSLNKDHNRRQETIFNRHFTGKHPFETDHIHRNIMHRTCHSMCIE